DARSIDLIIADRFYWFVGLKAKSPMLFVMAIIYLGFLKEKAGVFISCTLIMMVFVYFNSILYLQYFIWYICLIPSHWSRPFLFRVVIVYSPRSFLPTTKVQLSPEQSTMINQRLCPFSDSSINNQCVVHEVFMFLASEHSCKSAKAVCR
ncbi:MAG TPA: hypothetical protein VEZ55_10245, partial [Chitinophagaceae bacterium]|nr:hypothetical protein [Chitinophagaceae bacterium]